MKSIHIAFCGTGFGHAARCLPIADKLSEKGYNVILSTHEPALSRVRKLGYDVKKVHPEGYLICKNGGFDINASFFYSLYRSPKIIDSIKRCKKVIDRENPELVISDSYLSTALLARKKNIKSLLISSQSEIDTGGIFDIVNSVNKCTGILSEILVYLADFTIIPDYPRPFTICSKVDGNAYPESKFRYVGPLINKYYDEVECAGHRGSVLVYFGDGPSQKMVSALDKISSKTGIRFMVFGSKKHKTRNMLFSGFTWNFYSYLKSSSCIITHGGHTTIMGASAFGKPVLAIVDNTYPEREQNLTGMVKKKIGIRIREKGLTEQVLEDAIFKVMSKGYRKNAEKYKNLSRKHNGLKNSIEIIENMMAR